MLVERASRFLKLFIPAIWRIKEAGKTVYITFDDGPCPEVTPRILDILDKYAIKATFFCVGENIKEYPHIFNLIKEQGHSVGNHSMRHIKGFNTNYKSYIKDVEDADEIIKSNLFRPPYGRITLRQLIGLKKRYKIVMWDVITRDYNPKMSGEKCFSIVKKFTRSGSIIVFHDSKKAEKNVIAALPQTIEWLLKENYQIKPIKL